ncbi:MAG: YopX family protein [Candidatus Paceibacterota bacterium]
MREIKFRAWDKETKEMIQVTHMMWRFHCGLRVDCLSNGTTLHDASGYELMQYTGLKDKNGKEIYEGDIISYPDTESDYVDVGIGVGLKCAEMSCYGFAPVVFALGTFGLDCDGGESLGRGFHSFEWITDTYGFTFKELEVIGNIYENPELAEAQKEGM